MLAAIFAFMKWKRVKKWLIILLIVYVAGGVALYYLQDAILFHPVRLKKGHRYSFKEPHEEINIPINDDETLNLVRFIKTDTVRRGVVLYFHGNKRNISWYSRFASHFTNNGYEVLMIDYPGFGKSSGKFSEKILYDWSRQLYKFARSTYASDSIIIYGKSMGTGLASYLASREKCRRLILETPYYDMPSVISHYLPIYPVGSMLHYKLPNYEYLQFVDEPVSIFHGTEDGVITYRNAKRLKSYLKTTDEFVTITGGKHNNLYSFPLVTHKLDSLLQR